MGRGARDLILVSSNSSTVEMLQADLKEHFNLHLASTGAEALKILREFKKSAIIMDHSIEDYLTDAFIGKVRNNPVTRNTPFIVVSREGSHSFVHQAVRAGVSHYIGIPYEPKVLLEKIETALDPQKHSSRRIYFELPTSILTLAFSFGRISFISPTGIHFETRLKLSVGDEVEFSCPLSDGINELSLKVKVTETSNDCFYNYPLAVDATWVDEKIAAKVKSWISTHRALNSPKKAKVLAVGLSVADKETLIKASDQSRYSIRFSDNLYEALENVPFLRPSGLLVMSDDWLKAPKTLQQRLLKELEKGAGAFLVRGAMNAKDKVVGAFECPTSAEGMALAIKERIPAKEMEPDRLYFSKALEDSRLKIFIPSKVLVLGELGLRVALGHEILPPANLQLDLKTFSAQNLRNPHVRVWPPKINLSPAETENGKWKASFDCHFLGINDSQGQAIQKWLRDEEMKDKRSQIHISPLTKEQTAAAALAEEPKQESKSAVKSKSPSKPSTDSKS